MRLKGRLLGRLFLVFLRIGAFTFGGGYAMLPIIYKDICETEGWIDEDEMDRIVLISQSLPGVMAVNCATQVGYRLQGLVGAVVCVLGATLPSLFIIMVLANLIIAYRDNPHVAGMFFMIRAAVSGLVFGAAVKMGKQSLKTVFGWALIIAAAVLTYLSLFNPIFLIIAGALAGYVYSGLGKERL